MAMTMNANTFQRKYFFLTNAFLNRRLFSKHLATNLLRKRSEIQGSFDYSRHLSFQIEFKSRLNIYILDLIHY